MQLDDVDCVFGLFTGRGVHGRGPWFVGGDSGGAVPEVTENSPPRINEGEEKPRDSLPKTTTYNLLARPPKKELLYAR